MGLRSSLRHLGVKASRALELAGLTLRQVSSRGLTRPDLEAIPAYKAGKPAPARLAGQRAPYKLSSNENPYPPLPSVRAAIARAAEESHRYPDFSSARLVHALAQRHSVSDDAVVVGTGSVAVLGHLVQASCAPGDEVVFAWRSFEAYPIVTITAGATPVAVPNRADHSHDVEAMLAAVTPHTRVMFLCTPNNPTGTALSGAAVEHVLVHIPDHVLVVLDEAYAEFVNDPAVVQGSLVIARELNAGRQNVVLLRTFSKAYGLAGLRVGYAIVAPVVAEVVRKVSTPFGVGLLAEEAALASLEAEPELAIRVAGVVSEREELSKMLRAAGVPHPPSQGNFIWIPSHGLTGDLAAACTGAGLSVRPFDGEGIRITIAEPEANAAVAALLTSWATRLQVAGTGAH